LEARGRKKSKRTTEGIWRETKTTSPWTKKTKWRIWKKKATNYTVYYRCVVKECKVKRHITYVNQEAEAKQVYTCTFEGIHNHDIPKKVAKLKESTKHESPLQL